MTRVNFEMKMYFASASTQKLNCSPGQLYSLLGILTLNNARFSYAVSQHQTSFGTYEPKRTGLGTWDTHTRFRFHDSIT